MAWYAGVMHMCMHLYICIYVCVHFFRKELGSTTLKVVPINCAFMDEIELDIQIK